MSARVLSPDGSGVRYDMTGTTDGYIAFGFSDDQRMVSRIKRFYHLLQVGMMNYKKFPELFYGSLEESNQSGLDLTFVGIHYRPGSVGLKSRAGTWT